MTLRSSSSLITMKMDARTDVYFEKLRFIGHWYGNTHVNHFQGIARTQSPTNKNYAPESPTFGVTAGVNQTEVQWKGLALEEPP